jgi:hypothetical protein
MGRGAGHTTEAAPQRDRAQREAPERPRRQAVAGISWYDGNAMIVVDRLRASGAVALSLLLAGTMVSACGGRAVGVAPDVADAGLAPLATGELVAALAVDATNLYWTDSVGNVMSIPKAGGKATTLASGRSSASGIAVDGTNVYWVDSSLTPRGRFGGLVMSVPIGGGALTTLAAGQEAPMAVAIDGANVYWSATEALARVAKGGGITTTLVSGQPVKEIAVDTASVYWTNDNTGTVMKMPVNGGAMTTLASGRQLPASVAVDGSRVYWAEMDFSTANVGPILSVPVDGGSVATLATGQSARGIALDATSVYWTGTFVARLPKGGGTVTTVASTPGPGLAIVVDDTSVYWTAYVAMMDTQIMRLTPK